MCTEEENLALMTRMKKVKKNFSQNKFSHSKKKVYNREFNKLKVTLYNCGIRVIMKGSEKKIKMEKKFHASITIKD